jgi:hypothetical protein
MIIPQMLYSCSAWHIPGTGYTSRGSSMIKANPCSLTKVHFEDTGRMDVFRIVVALCVHGLIGGLSGVCSQPEGLAYRVNA